MMEEKIETPEIPQDAPNIEKGTDEQPSVAFIDKDNIQTRQFTAYAAPMRWGPWLAIASHNIPLTFNIGYRVIGNTLVHGAVNYYGPSGWVTQVFRGSITIRTGNGYANVSVCFHGNPLGSTINGAINP